jgi:hypothetical protein
MIIVDFLTGIYRCVMVVPQMNDVTGAYRLSWGCVIVRQEKLHRNGLLVLLLRCAIACWLRRRGR